jgi:hypothetical protein
MITFEDDGTATLHINNNDAIINDRGEYTIVNLSRYQTLALVETVGTRTTAMAMSHLVDQEPR